MELEKFVVSDNFNILDIKKRIFKNISWLSLSELISRLLKFLLIIYIARILGASKFGKFSFGLNFVAIFAIFADFGISTIITREVAKEKQKAKEYFSYLISLKTILILFSLLIMNLVGFFIAPDLESKKLIFVLSFYGVFSSLFDFLNSFFRAFQKMKYEAIGKIINSLICVSLSFIVLFKFPSILNISFSYVIAIILTSFFLIFILRKKFFKLSFKIKKSFWKKILSISWPLAFIIIFTSICHYVDSVMLGAFNFFKENGFYNAAYRIIDISQIPAIMVSLAIFPVISYAFKSDLLKPLRKKTFDLHLNLVTLLAIPLLLFGLFFAKDIILFFYGKNYEPSVFAFEILLFTLFVIYLSHPFFRTLIAANLQKLVFFITLSGAILNIILNFILIPKYTLYGAAISTFLTYFFMFFFYIFILKKKTKINFFDREYFSNLGIFSFSAFSSIGVTYLVNFNIIFKAIVATILYFLLLYLFFRIFKFKKISDTF